MYNKIIAGAFATIIGTMAVKVFGTIRKNNKAEIVEEVIEDELQN